jgi:photosystem II stability/assembly factor-like uncharacterized protein
MTGACAKDQRVEGGIAMKKLSFFAVAVFFSVMNAISSHALQIVKQFEERSYYLKDVCFISSDLGWAVGMPHWDQAKKKYVGTIIKTTNGGKTWSRQTVPVSKTLRGLSFVDDKNGWAVGEKGTIVHTTDGGQSWKNQTVGTTNEFRGVVFTDQNNGWATSIKPIHFDHWGDADGWKGNVWHTNNGGLTWTRQTLPAGAGILNRIDFIDSNNGWAVGIKLTGYDQYGYPEHVGAVYHTENEGQTWVEQYTLDVDIVLTGVDFVDADHGWAVGFKGNSAIEGGTVLHTADGGKTWERQSPDATLWDVQFVDDQKGYAVGFDYIGAWGPPVYRTLDGGNTWKKVHMEKWGGEEGLFAIAIAGNRAIVVGDHDYLCTSQDPWGKYGWPSGHNLFSQKYLNVHYRFEDVFFADENHGWAVGKRSYVPDLWGQVVLFTQNGGESWKPQYQDAPNLDSLFEHTYRLDSLFFTDALNGWAVGGSSEICSKDYSQCENLGAILHTTDGGYTWTQQGAELFASWNLEFFSTRFLDANNGWALAESRFPSQKIFLARTTDGGASWDWVDTGINGFLGIGFHYVQGGLDFVDAQHGWLVGGLGKVVNTEDGGKTWNKQEIPSCTWCNLHAVDFIDSQTGWIAGEGLFRTSNGGADWTEQATGISQWFHDIEFVDGSHGWVVGGGGVVANTTDGGDTWDIVKSKTSFELLGLSFLGPENGWIVGDGGVILSIKP